MAMDLLRFCHYTEAEFGEVPGRDARQRWYLCKPGAKAFPHEHAFGSPVWEPARDDWTDGPGVKWPPVKFSRLHIPSPDGQEFHGKPEWYKTGIPEDVILNPALHENPVCPGYEQAPLVEGSGKVGTGRRQPIVGGTYYLLFAVRYLPIP